MQAYLMLSKVYQVFFTQRIAHPAKKVRSAHTFFLSCEGKR